MRVYIIGATEPQFEVLEAISRRLKFSAREKQMRLGKTS